MSTHIRSYVFQISHLNGKIVEDNEELAQCQKASEAMRENLHKEVIWGAFM